MFIAPKPGHSMSAWSLEAFVPPVTPCPGSYEEQGCYFVFYARGVGDGNVSFWIEIEASIFSYLLLESELKSVSSSDSHIYLRGCSIAR